MPPHDDVPALAAPEPHRRGGPDVRRNAAARRNGDRGGRLMPPVRASKLAATGASVTATVLGVGLISHADDTADPAASAVTPVVLGTPMGGDPVVGMPAVVGTGTSAAAVVVTGTTELGAPGAAVLPAPTIAPTVTGVTDSALAPPAAAPGTTGLVPTAPPTAAPAPTRPAPTTAPAPGAPVSGVAAPGPAPDPADPAAAPSDTSAPTAPEAPAPVPSPDPAPAATDPPPPAPAAPPPPPPASTLPPLTAPPEDGTSRGTA